MDYQEMFQQFLKSLERKKYIDTHMIERAFHFAEEMHTGQVRKSGEPYIVHPIEVAKILAELNFDENVITAALLHDVVEDCGCSISVIQEKFNGKIAKLVDSVTAIEMEKKDRMPEFYQFLVQEQTYSKLYSFGKNDKLAFYVKFADRLHNLRTIDIFPRYKQIEKVKETEKYLIPILSSIQANTLFYAIKNECYRVLEPENYSYFNMRYQAFLKKGQKRFSKLFTEFELNLSQTTVKKLIGNTRVVIQSMQPYELIVNEIPKLNIEVNKIKEFMMNRFVTHKIFIIVKNNTKMNNKQELLFQLFSSSNWFSTFKMVDFLREEKNDTYPMVVEDDIGNRYAIYLQTEKEQFQYHNGHVEGIEIPYDEESKEFEISGNYIKVKTNTGKEIMMPEHSTVLDFAFKIHNDFGFSTTGAYLNNSPTKVPIYTILNNGDQVNLVIERDELTGACVYMAKIKWLSYVNTEYAKKKLSKYFENMYES